MDASIFQVDGAPLKLLLLGGQKSGKSRQAELLARQWLQADAGRSASLVATGTAYDAEMQERIARHQRDRLARVPQLATLEAPREVAQQLQAISRPEHLLVVDCLTLWLTNWLMPIAPVEPEQAPSLLEDWQAQCNAFIAALQTAPGPVILVSNEIGLGVIPMGREVRAFVDALGLLNQQAAAVCNRVQLMAAGLPLQMK
ncbi:adenosylcobinamide kinase/adenosylcobinamide-phosphate guanylyltransferase [Comamonas sp. BIGb0152]|uniref:bifunctional adenosylcobinamide kinase/adenosylcobinamide-phosphate guanylyltransferase n=1 Tax=Comamonas sp. BIGb0152 TaxID=2940601 RepID=UPI00216A68E2|nr:bifunctional adenosylcobinamide kinase/adenosylcobinamide-phosphate guanylyltransferase [Comamonas sp. BIGb0152]MCS4291880.1 adenosylcobinamide kinase/adenosylcobinamide-phosphate guanylyltransferase [Comamonas sp. BIGb0152]